MSEPLFAVIGDPHIVRPRYVTTQLLREKIVFLNTVKDLEYVLITGDISHEATMEQFKLAKSMLDRLKAPYFCCAGNHDMPLNTTDLSGYRAVFG
ncbi:MAG: metallophosphoesterase, partial [Desulfobacterales bacterium]|nr:metallophosphoesterase [Desulfobacterales bacterium]